jgi:hypothetical protein
VSGLAAACCRGRGHAHPGRLAAMQKGPSHTAPTKATMPVAHVRLGTMVLGTRLWTPAVGGLVRTMAITEVVRQVSPLFLNPGRLVPKHCQNWPKTAEKAAERTRHNP